jgi:LmbE family N-acetylglucosaminyl deacetylase
MAAEVLGLRRVSIPDYMDGDLDRADAAEAIAKITTHLREIRPQVVVTFGPDGAYRHPDHGAISQFTTAAIVQAAGSTFPVDGLAPHRVAKLYYMAGTKRLMEAYQAAFGVFNKSRLTA